MMSRKIRSSDEKGATIVEASIILPIFLAISFFIILTSIHIFNIYSTYYSCFQSLKSASTGPRVINSSTTTNGTVASTDEKSSVPQILKKEMEINLEKFKAGVKISDVIVRNQFGCYYLSNFRPAQLDGCTNTLTTLKITPNSWVTLDVPVKPIDLKILNVALPSVSVKSTVRMYDWLP